MSVLQKKENRDKNAEGLMGEAGVKGLGNVLNGSGGDKEKLGVEIGAGKGVDELGDVGNAELADKAEVAGGIKAGQTAGDDVGTAVKGAKLKGSRRTSKATLLEENAGERQKELMQELLEGKKKAGGRKRESGSKEGEDEVEQGQGSIGRGGGLLSPSKKGKGIKGTDGAGRHEEGVLSASRRLFSVEDTHAGNEPTESAAAQEGQWKLGEGTMGYGSTTGIEGEAAGLPGGGKMGGTKGEAGPVRGVVAEEMEEEDQKGVRGLEEDGTAAGEAGEGNMADEAEDHGQGERKLKGKMGEVSMYHAGYLIEVIGETFMYEGEEAGDMGEMKGLLLGRAEFWLLVELKEGGWIERGLRGDAGRLVFKEEGPMAEMLTEGGNGFSLEEMKSCPRGWTLRSKTGRLCCDLKVEEVFLQRLERAVRAKWDKEAEGFIKGLELKARKRLLSDKVAGASTEAPEWYSYVLFSGIAREVPGGTTEEHWTAYANEAQATSGLGGGAVFQIDVQEYLKRARAGGALVKLGGKDLGVMGKRQLPYVLFKLRNGVMAGVAVDKTSRVFDRMEVRGLNWRKSVFRQFVTHEQAQLLVDSQSEVRDNLVVGVRGFVKHEEVDEYLRRGVMKALNGLGMGVTGFMCLVERHMRETELVLVAVTKGDAGERRRRPLGWTKEKGLPRTGMWIAGVGAELFLHPDELRDEPGLGALAKQGEPYPAAAGGHATFGNGALPLRV